MTDGDDQFQNQPRANNVMSSINCKTIAHGADEFARNHHCSGKQLQHIATAYQRLLEAVLGMDIIKINESCFYFVMRTVGIITLRNLPSCVGD